MDARLHAYGVGLFSSSASDDRITYEVPLPQGDATTVDSLRELLGTTGAFSIALLGADPVDVGAHVTVPPLVTGDAVIDARTGVDQAGTPTLDLTFDATAAAAVADATRTHVGEYLAVALDGVAIIVPVINERDPRRALQTHASRRTTRAGAARADPAIGPAAAAGGGGHALRRATSLGWCPATGSARDAAAAPDPATAGCQCGAASGGTNAAIRAISRRMRRPSTGPRA